MFNLSEELKKLGYTWEVTADGYKVWYKGEFVSGASVMLPRPKPLHWKHVQANRKDNNESAVSVARTHALKIGLLKGVL